MHPTDAPLDRDQRLRVAHARLMARRRRLRRLRLRVVGASTALFLAACGVMTIEVAGRSDARVTAKGSGASGGSASSGTSASSSGSSSGSGLSAVTSSAS